MQVSTVQVREKIASYEHGTRRTFLIEANGQHVATVHAGVLAGKSVCCMTFRDKSGEVAHLEEAVDIIREMTKPIEQGNTQTNQLVDPWGTVRSYTLDQQVPQFKRSERKANTGSYREDGVGSDLWWVRARKIQAEQAQRPRG